MNDRRIRRLKRAVRVRFKIDKSKNRITVFRSSKHIYAQIITSEGKVLAQASTLNKNMSKMSGAKMVGESIAKQAKDLKLEGFCLDCAGFKYHGRIKQLADSARSTGLKI